MTTGNYNSVQISFFKVELDILAVIKTINLLYFTFVRLISGGQSGEGLSVLAKGIK